MESTPGRIGIFVDAATCNERNLDFAGLIARVSAGRSLANATIYAITNDVERWPDYRSRLEMSGVSVKLRSFTHSDGLSAIANWDVGIIVDILRMIDEINTVIIVTAEGDFEPFITYLMQVRHKSVEIIGNGSELAKKLGQVAKKYTDLWELMCKKSAS